MDHETREMMNWPKHTLVSEIKQLRKTLIDTNEAFIQNNKMLNKKVQTLEKMIEGFLEYSRVKEVVS